MNFVYKIVFTERMKRNLTPFMYVGSKSNAKYENGVMIDARGKEYFGSSSYDGYSDIIKNDDIDVEILGEFETYEDALTFEKKIHEELDVVANKEYFNKAIASVNNFSDPDYATYKHHETGKTVRLNRNHPSVLSGEYVGVSKGNTLSEETKKKIGRKGELNPFFGKKHSEESKRKIVESRDNTYLNDPNRLEDVKNILSKTAKKTFSGVPKSEEQKRKMGRKGLIMLKNRETGETIRIPKDDKNLYDGNIWVNPYILSENKSTGSKWITDGSVNKKIKCDDVLPDGWKYGRTYTGWNKNKKGKQMRIASIKSVGRKPVYDISVDADNYDDQHYVLKNGVITHNTGIMYSANQVFIIGKSQEKDSGELAGYKFTINIEKSRYVREKAKLPFTVLYESGVQKWSGMFDLALEAGYIVKATQGWYNTVDVETGEVIEPKKRAKDIDTNDEFYEELIACKGFNDFIEHKYKLGAVKNAEEYEPE